MLRVMIIKPSKYGPSGYVERFRRGFMPNSTVPYIRSMTPASIDGVPIETYAIDEYVQTDLGYLDLLRNPDKPTLLALVGVQSHQFQRALDLAAFAKAHGVEHCVIGGPHPMTCDTSMLQNRGVSFALAEAELIWPTILRDAIHGELQPVYGADQRWAQELQAPVLIPPSKQDLRRYLIPMLGIYPARGCPFTCNFCSVIKIAGRNIRGQDIETTMESLRKAKTAGVRLVMFTSDNFNKYAEATALLDAMIEEKLNIPFFVQCDTQVAKQEAFVQQLGRARCFQIFVGVESFKRQVLLSVHKTQNHPKTYGEIVRMCQENGITTHFSNIIGFPGQTPADILEHSQILQSLGADIASFYILTPIPGTEQYDNFLASGARLEENLDRYDATCPTWDHDIMGASELQTQMFDCYRRFYSAKHIFGSTLRSIRNKKIFPEVIPGFGAKLFHRYSAWKRQHPMSGGVSRVLLDSVNDYREFRKNRFGFDLVPLPKSLELSRTDAALNARVKLEKMVT